LLELALKHAVEDSNDQIIFTFEVKIKCSFAETCLLGNIIHARGVKAFFGEDAFCGIDNLVFSFVANIWAGRHRFVPYN
jgi:hypothetical protein